MIRFQLPESTTIRRLLAAAAIVLCVARPSFAGPGTTPGSGQAATIRISEMPHWQPGYTLFLLPDQAITIETHLPGGPAYRWSGDGQFVLPASVKVKADPTGKSGPVLPAGSAVSWKAPGTIGPAELVLTTATSDGWSEAARLTVQVMAPFDKLANGVLNGYRIGRYPARAARATQPETDYGPPPGFLRLPKSGDPVPVSPRFFLHDFACKQRHAGDRYVALRPELLRFLEAIVDKVESEGFHCSRIDPADPYIELASLSGDGEAAPGRERRIDVAPEAPGRPVLIMSGYRTPAYNRSLGNVRMSRHQYGDAADLIIDTNGDGSMDDLNRDGRVDGDDAITLAGWIEELWETPEFADRPGGLGIYNAGGDHGPFVHVDTRGSRARWGGNGLDWDDESGPAPAIPRSTRKGNTIVVR